MEVTTCSKLKNTTNDRDLWLSHDKARLFDDDERGNLIETRLAVVRKQRTLRFFGHVVRRDGSSPEKLMTEGKTERKRSRGTTPMRWIDQIKTATGYPLGEAIRTAENRELWPEDCGQRQLTGRQTSAFGRWT